MPLLTPLLKLAGSSFFDHSHKICQAARMHGIALKSDTPYSYGLMDLQGLKIYLKQPIGDFGNITLIATSVFRSAYSSDIAILFLVPVNADSELVWNKPQLATTIDFRPLLYGKEVLGLGYAEPEDISKKTGDVIIQSTKPILAPGHIVDIYPDYGGSKTPFPSFYVATDWLGGMSGGPVFQLRDGSLAGIIVGSPVNVDTEPPISEKYIDIEEPSRGKAAYLWPILCDEFSSPEVNEGRKFCFTDLIDNNSDLKDFRIAAINYKDTTQILEENDAKYAILLDKRMSDSDGNFPKANKSIKYARDIADMIAGLPEDSRTVRRL